MVNRDFRVGHQNLVVAHAVSGALEQFSPARFVEIVRGNPEITIHQFCKEYLAEIEVRCCGGTQRAYYKIWSRLHRARKKLGLSVPS